MPWSARASAMAARVVPAAPLYVIPRAMATLRGDTKTFWPASSCRLPSRNSEKAKPLSASISCCSATLSSRGSPVRGSAPPPQATSPANSEHSVRMKVARMVEALCLVRFKGACRIDQLVIVPKNTVVIDDHATRVAQPGVVDDLDPRRSRTRRILYHAEESCDVGEQALAVGGHRLRGHRVGPGPHHAVAHHDVHRTRPPRQALARPQDREGVGRRTS